MTEQQKSRKELIEIIKGDSQSVCIWGLNGSCQTSGLRDYLKKPEYDGGNKCKCFAYVPLSYIKEVK